jgi:hypothetical protein
MKADLPDDAITQSLSGERGFVLSGRIDRVRSSALRAGLPALRDSAIVDIPFITSRRVQSPISLNGLIKLKINHGEHRNHRDD